MIVLGLVKYFSSYIVFMDVPIGSQDIQKIHKCQMFLIFLSH